MCFDGVHDGWFCRCHTLTVVPVACQPRILKGERSPKDTGKTGAATGDGGRHTFGIQVFFVTFPVTKATPRRMHLFGNGYMRSYRGDDFVRSGRGSWSDPFWNQRRVWWLESWSYGLIQDAQDKIAKNGKIQSNCSIVLYGGVIDFALAFACIPKSPTYSYGSNMEKITIPVNLMKTCMVGKYVCIYGSPNRVYIYNYIIYACDSQRLIGNVPNETRMWELFYMFLYFCWNLTASCRQITSVDPTWCDSWNRGLGALAPHWLSEAWKEGAGSKSWNLNMTKWYWWWFRNPANQLRLVVYSIIYRALYIPGGAGFLPWTVPSSYFNDSMIPVIHQKNRSIILGQPGCKRLGCIGSSHVPLG